MSETKKPTSEKDRTLSKLFAANIALASVVGFAGNEIVDKFEVQHNPENVVTIPVKGFDQESKVLVINYGNNVVGENND